MTAFGTSRHFGATRNLVAICVIADMGGLAAVSTRSRMTRSGQLSRCRKTKTTMVACGDKEIENPCGR